MTCKIRKWELSDAAAMAAALSNKKVQDNLRDGLPYPYTEHDGTDYISAMLLADENDTFAFAITVDNKVIGSIGIFRQGNIHRQTAELGYYIAEERSAAFPNDRVQPKYLAYHLQIIRYHQVSFHIPPIANYHFKC